MIEQVRPAQLAAWIQSHAAAGRPAVVLDVREPWELAVASIQPDGFALAAIPMNLVPVRLRELDRSQPVAVLCHHGARSQQVAMFLRHQGFSDVANIAGGIDLWSCELDPGVPRY